MHGSSCLKVLLSHMLSLSLKTELLELVLQHLVLHHSSLLWWPARLVDKSMKFVKNSLAHLAEVAASSCAC